MTNSPVILKNIGVLCALFLFVGCNEEEYKKVQAEIADLNVELREAKEAKNVLKTKEFELKKMIFNFESFQKKERDIRIEMNEISDYHRDLKAAFEYTSALTDKWKIATRRSLIGEKLGLVRLADKTLADAIVVELDPEKVVLKYAGGQETFELSKLPEPLRKKLIHEPTILLESEISN